MTKTSLEERRRLLVYRNITSIERWLETLTTLRDYSRANAVQATTANNPTASSYFNGKADGIEELIAKCHASKHIEEGEKVPSLNS